MIKEMNRDNHEGVVIEQAGRSEPKEVDSGDVSVVHLKKGQEKNKEVAATLTVAADSNGESRNLEVGAIDDERKDEIDLEAGVVGDAAVISAEGSADVGGGGGDDDDVKPVHGLSLENFKMRKEAFRREKKVNELKHGGRRIKALYGLWQEQTELKNEVSSSCSYFL